MVSTTDDNTAQAGELIELIGDSFITLPPFIATLDSDTDRSELAANQKDREEVTLACQLTEVGTLQIECVSISDSNKRWKVEFAIRKDLARLDRQDSQSTLAESELPPRMTDAVDAIKKSLRWQ